MRRTGKSVIVKYTLARLFCTAKQSIRFDADIEGSLRSLLCCVAAGKDDRTLILNEDEYVAAGKMVSVWLMN
jgi:hypothetical protein